MSGGGKSGGSTTVYDYRMSIQYGLSFGPVDSISEIYVAEKALGIPVITDNAVVSVSRGDLFGGEKQGGGVSGVIQVLMGHEDQVMPSRLAAKMGRTSTTVSANRGLLSLFFTGFDGTKPPEEGRVVVRPSFEDLPKWDDPGPFPWFSNAIDRAIGFLWGTNNPILPSVWVTATCAPTGFDDPGGAMIGEDANPAHTTYSVLVEDCGYAPEQVNLNSFRAAAQVYRDEGFGLSFFWEEQQTGEAFISHVLEHVNTNLSFNLATGKWDLIPLRGGYDRHNLPELNPGNCELDSFQRRAWGEILNEVVVTWTNPANEKTETVSQIDSTGFQIQQSFVSDSSKNFRGIRSQKLALEAAERELRQAAAPLAAAEVTADRSFAGTQAGDVVVLDWRGDNDLDLGLRLDQRIVMRVLKVAPGRKGSPGVKLSLVEDIFSFGTTPVSAQPNESVNPAQDPVDPLVVRVFSAPYFVIAQAEGDAAAQSLEYPDAVAVILAETGLVDIRQIDVISQTTIATGDLQEAEIATIDDLAYAVTATTIPQETVSTIPIPGTASAFSAPVGSFLLIRHPTTDSEELCLVTEETGTSLTVARGVLDTAPQRHPAGAELWVLPTFKRFVDPTRRSAGENPEYWLLPSTSKGRLPRPEATMRTGTLNERAHLPTRPANLRADGLGIGDNPVVSAGDDSVVISWSTRNRLTETAVALRWADASVTPEEGQTVALQIFVDGNLAHVETDLVGDSFEWEWSSLSAGSEVRVLAWAVRDSILSHQPATLDIAVTA